MKHAIRGNGIATHAEASFTLKDANPGDVFDVQVIRDARFGTFWFNTTRGFSKCPHEPNTVARELPELELLSGPSGPSPPTEYQTFQFYLRNKGRDVSDFIAYVDMANVRDDAQLNVAGNWMAAGDRLFQDIEPDTSYPVLVQVMKGSMLFTNNFTLGFRSACETAKRGNDVALKFMMKSQKTFSASWFDPCPAVSMVGQLQGLVGVADGTIYVSLETPVKKVKLTAKNQAPNGKTWVDLIAAGKVANCLLYTSPSPRD